MNIWKIVSGIFSIVLCFFMIFQSCAAGLFNALTGNGDISGSAGILVAALILVGGITSIATRNALGNGGNVAIIVIYGLAAAIGYLLAGSYADLVFWATWCVVCAIVAAIAIAADNIFDTWVYAVIVIAGIIIAAAGFGLNFHGEKADGQGQKNQIQNHEDSGQEEDKPEDTEDKNNSGSAGSGALGEYYVEIKGAELGKDYSGEDVIIITYAWTNNSEETKSAMVATSEKAFQDGIEMESAYVVKDVDFSNNSKDVRPGSTIDVKKAYALKSNSTVEFEVTEWISFSDDIVAMNFEPAELS